MSEVVLDEAEVVALVGQREAAAVPQRVRMIEIAAPVEVLKHRVRLHLPRATPDQAIFAHALWRMQRLII